MRDMEFRAYDNKQRTMVYNKDLWLPKELKKLGHKEYPVYVTENGIHYTLDCLSNHYENDWEEDVTTIYDIEIMQFTNYWDCQEPSRKIYCNDIISFFVKGKVNYPDATNIGMVKYSEQSGDWIVVDKDEKFIEMLSRIEQPKVLGNWFDNPELLDGKVCC
ncbi:MAG: YopX family protein [Desulfitobacterium hafniense]|nr:YopX family protein [Desulfitobacterium hafniense]